MRLIPHSAFRTPHWALIAIGTCAAAAPTSASDWPMFRGNPQLTGIAEDRLVEPLKAAWKFQVEEPFGSTAAIVNGIAYVGCDDSVLYAIDIADGAPVWRFTAQGPIKSSPLVLGDTVYFGDDEGVVYALNTSSEPPPAGAKPRGAASQPASSPTTTSAPADPRLRWSFRTEGQVISSPNHAAGKILLGSYDGFLYCLDARGGDLVWKHQTEDRLHGTPGIAGDRVLIAGCDQRLHVIDVQDGKPMGEVALGAVSGGSAALAGKHVYLGTYGNQVLGIDWSAAQVLWTFQDPDRQFPFMGSAAVTPRETILGGRDKRLRAFDPATGAVQWTFVAGGRIDSSPVISGERVWVGSSDGNLYALDLATGQEKWRFESGAPFTASPAIAAGMLVIGNEDGVLYGFAGESPRRREGTNN